MVKPVQGAPWVICKNPSDLPEHRVIDKIGIVYFVQAGKVTKIGCTNSPRTRVQAIASNIPTGIDLAAYSIIHPTFRESEKILHKYFEKRWVKGEWYKLRIADIDFPRMSIICNLVPEDFYHPNNAVWLRGGKEYRRLPSSICDVMEAL
jgi:hypothetical protein